MSSTDSRGFRVSPYKMEIITGLAHRITKIIVDNVRFSLTADEVLIALDVVRGIVKGDEWVGGDENPLEEAKE